MSEGSLLVYIKEKCIILTHLIYEKVSVRISIGSLHVKLCGNLMSEKERRKVSFDHRKRKSLRDLKKKKKDLDKRLKFLGFSGPVS